MIATSAIGGLSADSTRRDGLETHPASDRGSDRMEPRLHLFNVCDCVRVASRIPGLPSPTQVKSVVCLTFFKASSCHDWSDPLNLRRRRVESTHQKLNVWHISSHPFLSWGCARLCIGCALNRGQVLFVSLESPRVPRKTNDDSLAGPLLAVLPPASF